MIQSPALALNFNQKKTMPTRLRSQIKGSTKLIFFLLDGQIWSSSSLVPLFFLSLLSFQVCLFLRDPVIILATDIIVDIWAEWWSDASTGSSTKSVEYWMGLYAFLNLLPLITISLWVAYVYLWPGNMSKLNLLQSSHAHNYSNFRCWATW